MPLLAYLLARLAEPSSYAGLGAVLALFGWNLSDTLVGQLAQLLAAACGLVALGLKERGVTPALVLAVVALPALSGCAGVPAAVLGGLGSAGSAYVALDRISEAASPFIATGCREYQKAKAAADAVADLGAMPTVMKIRLSSIESFGDAACTTPPAGDPLSTAIWLGHLAGQLATLTAAAK